MPKPRCSDDEFISLCKQHRSAVVVARALKQSSRSVLERRRTMEAKYNIVLSFDAADYRSLDVRRAEQKARSEINSINSGRKAKIPDGKRRALSAPPEPDAVEHVPSEWRYQMRVRNGCLVIGSDAHYKPEIISTAHRAMVTLVKRLKPDAVILNGDLLDGSSISRHFRIRWHRVFTVKEELETLQDRLAEIEAVAGNAKLIRTWGNHDSNFETRLSGHVPQYEGLAGFTLWEHLPKWQPCMSVFVNDERGLVVKHRFKGGMHAPHNNTLWAGRSMATGHLHSQKVQPITDYNGTRYGVDTGTIATPEDEAFHYAEDDPRNWRSGFAVLTFVDGELMPPDLVTVISKDRVWFRGEAINV